MKVYDSKEMVWTREPKSFSISNQEIVIETQPHTDLWQRTYYHFQNDNAPLLQMTIETIIFLSWSKPLSIVSTALTNVDWSCT